MKCPGGCGNELTDSDVVSKTKSETVVRCMACDTKFTIKNPEKQPEKKP
jgi:uncharacterized Zn finger protein